jgi:hypothetical protein
MFTDQYAHNRELENIKKMKKQVRSFFVRLPSSQLTYSFQLEEQKAELVRL